MLLKRMIVILGSSPRSHFKDDTVAFPSFWLVEKRAGLFSCDTSKLSTDDALVACNDKARSENPIREENILKRKRKRKIKASHTPITKSSQSK